MMRHEFVTALLTKVQLNDELNYVCQHFHSHGREECEVLFAWAWGMEYYESDVWEFETFSLDAVEEKVREVEASGAGELSCDDLVVRIGALEFRFCHESDLHLEFPFPNDMTEHFFSRWSQLGYCPTERQILDGNNPKTKLR